MNSLADLPDPPDPPDPADQVSETAARTYLPHAPGVRMTVVTLTPSNYGLASCRAVSEEPCAYLVLHFWDRFEFQKWRFGFLYFLRDLVRLT